MKRCKAKKKIKKLFKEKRSMQKTIDTLCEINERLLPYVPTVSLEELKEALLPERKKLVPPESINTNPDLEIKRCDNAT